MDLFAKRMPSLSEESTNDWYSVKASEQALNLYSNEPHALSCLIWSVSCQSYWTIDCSFGYDRQNCFVDPKLRPLLDLNSDILSEK